MNFASILEQSVECTCGRTHSVQIDTVEIDAGALKKVPTILKRDGYMRPFLIADQKTYEVAGKQLVTYLEEEGINYSVFVYEDQELIPNEQAVGKLLLNFNTECDVVIGIGSGTINDLSRFFSHQVGLRYYIVATAPSMDGYASTVAPLIRNSLKTTFECQMPQAIIGDLEVISRAPKDMIAAGFGDVIGKYTCLADWKLSALINGEYYCETAARMTLDSLQRTIDLKEGISNGDYEAIGELMEALVLAGIAMSYVGNSRPASGSEHHLSHFWEMRFIFEGKNPVLHGTKVGIATVLVARLYQYLKEEGLDAVAIEKITRPNMDDWKDEMNRVFLGAASEVISLEERVGKNAASGHQARIAAMAKNWRDIEAVLNTVPEPQVIISLLKSVQAPVFASQVGISEELIQEAILYAKEIRPRYTILQLLWDLDVLPAYATRIVKECDN
ncbi:MAG: sn-glycerol-1-phosphate dehydrogenase [Firmicutes bacterium]|nr:sn-glycerol-1-phosphate dehydrogenase [Bacillota bacterium]